METFTHHAAESFSNIWSFSCSEQGYLRFFSARLNPKSYECPWKKSKIHLVFFFIVVPDYHFFGARVHFSLKQRLPWAVCVLVCPMLIFHWNIETQLMASNYKYIFSFRKLCSLPCIPFCKQIFMLFPFECWLVYFSS